MERPAPGGNRSGPPQDEPAATPQAVAEASVWVARLHGPNRTRRMELDCLAWQARSAANRLAFERCTDVWQMVPNLPAAQAHAAAAAVRGDRARGRLAGSRMRWALALGLAGLATAAVVLLHPWRAGDAYATAFGEQRQVLLDDGTRMWLNTETRVRVALQARARTVAVDAGEALFEVASDAQRPFVVRVAASEVVALGTVFSVRLMPGAVPAQDALAVTLLEGQVAVRPTPGEGDAGLAPAAPIVMQAGQRVRLVAGASPSAAVAQVDRPAIDPLVAWRRSEAVFDNVPLADAVAEMNRYSRTPIVLQGDAALNGTRISGLFRTGDNASFARAAAALHGLAVQERPGRLELSAVR